MAKKSTRSSRKGASLFPRRIVGRVTSKQRSTSAWLIVRALSVDLKRSTTIGETLTDASGSYEIAYEAASDPVHGQVEVLSFAGESLAHSEVRFSAGRREVIDVAVDARPLTEYDQIRGAVRLVTADIPDQPLTQEDAPFLLDRMTRLPYSLP